MSFGFFLELHNAHAYLIDIQENLDIPTMKLTIKLTLTLGKILEAIKLSPKN